LSVTYFGVFNFGTSYLGAKIKPWPKFPDLRYCNDCIKYRIMAAMKVETDIIANITSSLKGWAVALVIMHVKNFKTDSYCNDCIKYRIMAAMKVETDIIANITARPKGWAVVLVIM
jgi:hypothetical protein